ncbi:uncharacterized protein DSM5745_03749 [Aspergillus mulundensis]|uniref:SRR1-like domain-containing protein n=1 Tax=Aspergillus mulundensis TaxID=1810919 RepID=A0A3D8SLA6_9EURO|nr:Uncharacterized protein DSM5745_03749 [Aspergillus mulundensis]RDW87107.1 Uncharacterized protein DSM5745_03749 [Aspergillus mulundensis]
MSLTATVPMHDDLPSPNPSLAPSSDLSLSTSSLDHDDHDLSETDVDVDVDMDTDKETLAKIHEKLAHINDLYASGQPLFPRSLLASLDAQIENANATTKASEANTDTETEETGNSAKQVTIPDLDSSPHTYSLRVPSWCADFASTYRISYSSIQNLTCIHPSFPEVLLRDSSPVSICYTSSPEAGHGFSGAEVAERFAESVRKWECSSTCGDLKRALGELVGRGKLSRVRKIVCFGLGSLSAHLGLGLSGDEYEFTVGRAHAQHAAVGTMVGVLRQADQGMCLGETGEANGEEGGADGNGQGQDRDPMAAAMRDGEETGTQTEIKCYAQDPAYNDTDQALLRSIGIQPLDDPKGFLAIDEETLVFSVSPNVPVKQIVADVQWPGAMLWNTVCAEERDSKWEKKVRDGEEVWITPFTTDPDSQRVRDMVKHYTSVPLRDSNEWFGDLTIYAR